MALPLDPAQRQFGLAAGQAFLKRAFDICVSLVLVLLLGWLIAILALAARIDTGLSGLFMQQRIGLYGEPFTLLKLRSMRPIEGVTTTVTKSGDPRITPFGAFLRRYKLDELPQLLNVFGGSMSLVGPRPDVASVYEGLDEASLRVLTVRPGITGPASIMFRNEEQLLSEAEDSERYNAEVLFPQKIRINLDYIDTYSLTRDIALMVRTVFG